MASTAASASTGCLSFFLSVVPLLNRYSFDFGENVEEFRKRKREVESKKADYEMVLLLATRNKMIAKNDVDNWYSDCKVKLEECDLVENDLGRNSGRKWWSCQTCKLSIQLLKMTQKITELITLYDEFSGSMFIEDLNRKILDDFEDTKCKFEALTVLKSLEEQSDQSDGIEKWRQEYEEMKRKCDGIENKLKNYNTEGESFSVCKEDLEKKTMEMIALIDRYNQFFSFQNIKKEFDNILQTYRREWKSVEIDGKIPTELVKVWMNDCELLQKKYGHGNTEIQADAESSHHQEQLICQMEEMKNLIIRYNNFHSFSNMIVDQPLATVEKRSIEYKPLNSMEENKKTVYAALKDEMVIRLFGMGGVGKTTLMQQINEEMSHKTDFKLVIWVTVSTTFADIKSIQNQISRRLKLKGNNSEDIFVRAKNISEYLIKQVDGNVLFIFDDVFEMLDLNAIGIPDGTYGDDEKKCCKIVLTTRDRNVKVIHPIRPKDIEVKELDEDESWFLFKINASIEDNIDDGIKELAEKICRKCSRLPLVITVIAKMLYREKEKAFWFETLTFLNKNDPSLYIPNLSNDVYIPLKLSYDRLGRNEFGSFFSNAELIWQMVEMKNLITQYNQFISLQNKKKEFDAMIESYRRQRKSAEIDGKIPTELVKVWMNDCELLQKKYNHGNTEIQADAEFSHRQEMEDMQNLITRYNRFNGSNMFVDQPLETVVKRSTEYKPLNSMEENKKTVYAALKDEMVIRLFGMGGVGKTTLMRQINDEMSNSSYFKLVIWVTVSTTFADIKSIQNQISRILELKGNDSEDIVARAKKISEYLKSNVDGNVLFIFDDVWKMLDLKAIGIPITTYGDDGRKCCKIVLTTRDRKVKVIHPMCPKDIEVKGLDEKESWILFKINAGIEDNIDDGIKELAENICKKCKGLPQMITVIAKMLHREEEKAIWSKTLRFLNKKDASRYIPNLSNDVYIPLRLSYDRLEREDLKIGFLLCSLFPEDYKIAVSDLLYYGLGAGEIAEGCLSFDACRNIFIHLKNKGLLQDGYNDKYSARMHDVIRDVAHFIAKKEFGGFFYKAELTKWISSVQNSSLEMENVLSLDLRLQRSTSLQADTTKSFIKKLKELRVLIFQGEDEDEEIPVNIKEYFILHNLSVLCLRNVYIEELDKDFSIGLCNLRVIDFSTSKIDVIRPKVFSNLHNKLEVLHMFESFNKWQASDEEDGEYVRFAELAELKKLYSLRVEIEDGEIFSHEYQPDLVFSSVKYFSINKFAAEGNWNLKQLYLSNIQLWNGTKWIKDLLKKTNTLKIYEKDEYLQSYSGGRLFNVALTKDILFSNLENLELSDFPSCKHVIQYSTNKEGHHITSKPILPKAKVLSISDFYEMENIFVSTLTPTVIPKGSFGKLQDISITKCPRLKFIFPWNVVTCLVQLKYLYIKYCVELEVIVEKEDNGDYNNQGEHVLFPELTRLELYDLPKLEYVLSRSDNKLKNLKPQFLLGESSAPNLKLQSIQISSCSKLKFIFSRNVATCLVQLKTLVIEGCDELEVIVEKEDNGDYNNQGEHALFPELTEMELYRLPKLEYVLSRSDKKLKNMKQQFLLGEGSAPNLKLQHISIMKCPRLKFIFPWNVATCLVQLEHLVIASCDELEVIVEKEDNGDYNNQGEHVLFPELTELNLYRLPKLEYVLSRSDKNLKNLKQMLLGESSAPNLKLLYW